MIVCNVCGCKNAGYVFRNGNFYFASCGHLVPDGRKGNTIRELAKKHGLYPKELENQG